MPASSSHIVANFGWLLAERGWRTLLGLFVNVVVARYLGPESFGLLSYALGFAAIFSVLGGLGIDDVLARELVRQRPRAAALFAAGLQLKVIGALAAYLLLMSVAWWWRPTGPEAWKIVVLAGMGLWFLPLDAIDIWFQARERMRPPVLARQTGLLVAALLRLVLVWVGAPLWVFALAVAIEAGLIALALSWVLLREGGEVDWKGAQAISRGKLLAEGLPLLASGALVMIALQADRLLLPHLAGEAATGLYAAAARFTEVFYVLPVALGAALLPRLMALKQTGEMEYWQTARRTTAGMLLATVFLAAALSAGGRWGLPLLLGEKYRAAGAVLAVHAWALVFISIVSLRSRLLVIEERAHGVLIMSVGTAALSVGANVWLIPRAGARGAAWAVVLTWAVSALVLPWLLPSVRPLMREWCGLAKPKRI
jgi:PST family polysaccharide transporter